MEQVPKPRDSHFFQIPSWLSLKHGAPNSKDSKFEQNDDSSFQKKLSEEVKKLKAKKERFDGNLKMSPIIEKMSPRSKFRHQYPKIFITKSPT